jgi:hypothetical protein
LKWLRNVWRIRRDSTPKSGSRYRLTDFLWWTRQEDVFNEMALLLNIETANTHTPGWFQLRTKASKNILNGMTDEERSAFQDEADRMQREGLTPDIQRRYVPKVLNLGRVSLMQKLII